MKPWTINPRKQSGLTTGSPESTVGFVSSETQIMYSLNSLHAPFPFPAGGQIHWSPKPSSPASTDFWPGTQSVDIELTAYVLLAYLSKPRVHAGDMTTAAGIVAWLTRQQNAYGGFASTQVSSSSPWILLYPRLAAQILLRSGCSESVSLGLVLSEQ